jgi:two-component sensor histidine kinase
MKGRKTSEVISDLQRMIRRSQKEDEVFLCEVLDRLIALDHLHEQMLGVSLNMTKYLADVPERQG